MGALFFFFIYFTPQYSSSSFLQKICLVYILPFRSPFCQPFIEYFEKSSQIIADKEFYLF